jgi:multicomponent Na+:H+ antiporter subunit D
MTTLGLDGISNLQLSILLILFIFGISKAAIMPFHSWLPAAMVAPTPVSALLHAVAVVKVGVFSIIKVVVYTFGIDLLFDLTIIDLFILLCGFTIIASSIVAIKQDNLKKLLAYSTISQLSYVIIAILILTPSAIIAATLHLVAHAISKIILFFAAGAIYTSTGYTKISEMNGIGPKLKIVMIGFSIGALSLIGLPILGGFVSKWYIVESALDVNRWFIISVIIISTLLNIGYFIPIIYKVFFIAGNSKKSLKKLPISLNLAIFSCSILIILLFLFPNFFIEVMQNEF